MLTEVFVSNIHNPTSNLHLTRKQLDDLDVLVQKMLNLPEANIPREAPQKAEPDFSSMGIFSPGEAPWAPKPIEPTIIPTATAPVIAQSPKEEYKPAAPQSILNRYSQSAPESSPKIEEVQDEPQATSEPTSGWKPSPLTWAPLAQSWEKLRQEELEKQQKEIKPSIVQPIEKLTEIGVFRFVPLDCEYSVVKAKQINTDKLRRSVIEASKQCLRNRFMEISEPITFAESLQNIDESELNLFANLEDNLAGKIVRGPLDKVNIWIGPEGGFSPAEVKLALEKGLKIICVGKTILRVETAAVVLAGLAIHSS